MEKYFSALEPLTLLNKDGIEKTAEEKKYEVDKKIMDFIKTIKPNRDKHVYTHVIAMGAGEFWGPNSNQDHFPIDDLFSDSRDYGFNTFLNAGVFQGHVNKDKNISLGPVLLSIANPVMKRVELIMRVDKDKVDRFGKDKIWDRLQDGENVGVSMGSRVPYDVCSVCYNKAKTRREYCDHMLSYPGKVMENGVKVFVYNPRPNFFDISFVGRPADKSARVLNRIEEKEDRICLGNICVVPNKDSFSEPEKREVIEVRTREKTAEEVKPAVKKNKTTKVVRTVKYRDIPVHIEVMSGDYRVGYNKGGQWKKKMYVHYGFIPKTTADDGEAVDVYLKPEANKSADVYVIKQMKTRDGVRSYDEDKIMMGFDSQHHAKSVYLQHMPEKCFGSIEKHTYLDFLNNYLPKYKEEVVKQASITLKEAFCKCGSDCCTQSKKAENKEADIVKRVPALMQKIPTELIEKVRNKKLCN